ncbi:hypothetical protein Q7C30_017110 [Pseudomonas sp. RAC1]|uniref:hypothetical protein n=1 Tax=Pseudomonas sp. RAC1 TaxID=3064900 RepID=UPI00271EA3A3|nr:hypothetical protein [Pseudomonas sp. RAC1]MDV9033813.1 hypothetical protein [Pseudomonas sp. RAC1]
MTKKLVPDPPLPCTTPHPFGRCDAGHPPLFSVNPDIAPHDALVHVALYLRCAYDAGIKALDHLRDDGRGLFWASLHSLEMAEGLVEAMLDAIESPPATVPASPAILGDRCDTPR